MFLATILTVQPSFNLRSIVHASVQSKKPKSAPHNYKEAWQKISKAIETQLFDHKQIHGQIKKWENEFGPSVEASTNDKDFRNRVEEFINKFNDSHFAVYVKRDQGYYLFDGLARGSNAESMPNCGAYFTKTDNGWVTAFVLDGTSAFKAGLREGDLVVKADGMSFSPVESFEGKEGKKVVLDAKRGSKTLQITVIGSKDQSMDQFLQATRDSERIIHADGLKIGYIHLWTQASQSFAAVLQSAVLGNLYHTDAFILDDRGGFGGRPEGYGNPFFLPDINLGWKTNGVETTEHFGYSKPLVLLIDHYCRSAKEVFSQIMKTSKRAVLVGQTTAGNVLGTYPNRINSWCYLEMPVMDVFVNGKRLEKVGVSPNIVAPLGFNSAGKDMTLEAGIKEAAKLVMQKKSQQEK